MEYRTIEQVLPDIELQDAVKIRKILRCIQDVLERTGSDQLFGSVYLSK